MTLVCHTLNDEALEGEVVVLIKKRRRTLMHSYRSIEDAYEIWASGGCVQEWKNIDELVREGFENYIIEMLDPSRKEKVRKAVKEADIKDGEPFIAFNPYNNDGLDLELLSFLPIDTPKKYLLESMIPNDVRNFDAWEADRRDLRSIHRAHFEGDALPILKNRDHWLEAVRIWVICEEEGKAQCLRRLADVNRHKKAVKALKIADESHKN